MLAIKWCVHNPKVSTTITSVTTTDLLKANLEVVLSKGLTTEELELITELEERFFKKTMALHWENIEVNAYWEELAQGGHKQNVD